MSLAVDIMTCFIDHLYLSDILNVSHAWQFAFQEHPYTVKKECFEKPLLVATRLQPILVFGNTILKHIERLKILSVAVWATAD